MKLGRRAHQTTKVIGKGLDRMPKSVAGPLWRGLTVSHVGLYRRTGGRLGASLGGVPFLLLHHIGRKSGQRRTTPLVYGELGDALVLVASKGGATKNPIWYLNLVANPDVEVDVGRERRTVRARVAEGEERQRAWDAALEVWAGYDGYQAQTDRKIPVILLEPR